MTNQPTDVYYRQDLIDRMPMRRLNLRTVVWKEGKHYVSQCLNVDVSSFGKTKKEALDNLQEALELYFDEPRSARVQKIERPEIISTIFEYA